MRYTLQMSTDPEQGEVTLVVEGAAARAPAPASDADVAAALRRLLERGVPGSQAAREVAAELGVPRGRAYDLAVALKHEGLVGSGEGAGPGKGAEELGVPCGRAYDLAVALKHKGLVGPGEGSGPWEGAEEAGLASGPGEAAGPGEGAADGRGL